MIFEQHKLGGDRNFSYLIGDKESREAAIVDPAYQPEVLIEIARKNSLTIKYVINTHNHFDHTSGNETVLQNTNSSLIAFGKEINGKCVKNGDIFLLGKLPLQIIHTPGHTTDSICIRVKNIVMTGDTLFVGKVGGTPTDASAQEEYDSLHQKLMILPGETKVYPGHDYGIKPFSTIEDEQRHNPFLIQPDFASFLDLKKNWAEYKRTHGIK